MFSYRRWRHTRGFGVHSPFAYRLIRYAVRPRPDYAFYADSDLEEDAVTSGCSGHELKRARRLLRLAATLGFLNAIIYLPDERECFVSLCEQALKAADSRMVVSRDPELLREARFFWTDACFTPPETLALWLAFPNAVLLLENAGDFEAHVLFKALPEGVMLVGRNRLLAVHKPGIMKVSYTANV